MKKESIGVLGGGTWGSTLAAHLAQQGNDVSVWEFDANVAKQLQNERTLKTLPGFKLPDSVQVTNNIGEAVQGKKIIFSVTPSHAVKPTFALKEAQNDLERGALVVSASKGIEQDTLMTMEQVIRQIFTKVGDIVILSGPSHAEEVAKGQPAALVVGSTSRVATKRIQDLLSSPVFRIYTSEDPIGLELGGAIKNVYALAGGVIDGLELGDNTKAALITRGLAEMTRLGVKVGASAITFFGLAGLGDLIVTCSSQHSRNRRLGEMLGKGKTLNQALSEMTMIAEGVKTTKSVMALAKKHGVDVPIIKEMFQILFEDKSPRDSLKDLMTRQVGAEMEGIVL